jgi:CBS-domain-containing membrane protein
MLLKKVGEIMIPLESYPHIPYWFSLRQTIAAIQSTKRVVVSDGALVPRWVLVFDEKYQLMGTVRRRDILRGLEPDFLAHEPVEKKKSLFTVKMDPNLSELSYDKFLEGMRNQAERPVSDVMQPIKITLDYDDHLMKAIYEMVDFNVSVIPVIQEGKVAGVLRSTDLLTEVANILL